ncbi:MAG TPA: urease subunit gamma [Actinomycetota bacterium]|nr:urease subunit gamma [Actinomycetota bacterium]
MQLNPTERDRLLLFTAAQLARETLARGLALNAPEAIALVCDEMHLKARSGASFEQVVDAGRAVAGRTPVLDGVSAIALEIRVEVLLDEGTRLIVLRAPFGDVDARGPGAVQFPPGEVELVPGRERRRLTVHNASRRPIRVSSHYPFWQVNPSLEFDREAARGFRLDLPAGDSLGWAPGEALDVDLVAYGGDAWPGAG